MNIKPFQTPDIDWFAVGLPAWITLLAAIIFIVVSTVASFKTKQQGYFMVFLLSILVVFPVGCIILGSSVVDVKQEAYANHVSDFKTSLADEGFTLINGTPDLYPNAKSDLVLEHHGKAFECKLFTPEDVKMDVLFSCGETNLGLEDIKEKASR